MDTEKIAWFGISTLIIAGMIYFADFSKVVEAVSRADVRFLVPAAVFGLSVFSVWSYTWYSFFQSVGMDISFLKSSQLFMAGNFFNSVTPLGQFGGEPFMAYVISKHTDYTGEKGFSVVLSADIINAVPSFTFLLGGVAYSMIFRSVSDLVVQLAYVAMVATVAGAVLVYVLWYRSGWFEIRLVRLVDYVTSAIGHGEDLAETFREKMLEVQDAFAEVGKSKATILKTGVVAHLGFLVQVLALASILYSLGIAADLTPLYFSITVSYLANVSPTPGGSGTFEAAMAGALNYFVGVPFATALVAAIIFRSVTYWPGILIGWASFNWLEKGA